MLVYENEVKSVKCDSAGVKKLDNAIINFAMRITQINIFPVKSMRGLSVPETVIEDRGPRFDRRWMIVDASGCFLTQREIPAMATIAVAADDDGIRFESNGSVHISKIGSMSDSVAVEIWNDRTTALGGDHAADSWLSAELGRDCRLVYMPVSARRMVDPEYAVDERDVVSFADAYPFHLIGEASLGELNRRLEDPVPMSRFRPNFVVEGSAAFAEDGWRRIRIGEVEFHVVKPCARCVIPSIDQESGERGSVEPTRTLASFRTFERNGAKKVLFGQNLIAASGGGKVSVGDAVEVLEFV